MVGASRISDHNGQLPEAYGAGKAVTTRRGSLCCLLIVSAVLGCATQADAQKLFTGQCLYGCPTTDSPAYKTNDIIVRSLYTLSSNDTTKLADWVAYRITRETIGPSRDRQWAADPLLRPEETLEPSDYDGANAALGVDRGHQAPLASLSGPAEWPSLNYLSNITPQASALNEGPWMRLEAAERGLLGNPAVDAVYVVTGPLYEHTMRVLPHADEPHKVPSGYWKVIALVSAGVPQAVGFVMEQSTKRDASFCDFITGVGEIERRSGFDLFSALRPEIQEGLEQRDPGLRKVLGCHD